MRTPIFAKTPTPPYYAVVFTSLRAPGEQGYSKMSDAMFKLAEKQDGFLGLESARDSEGLGITVSYWTDPEAIRRWKANAEHRAAQQKGRDIWYSEFRVRICRVEREYPA